MVRLSTIKNIAAQPRGTCWIRSSGWKVQAHPHGYCWSPSGKLRLQILAHDKWPFLSKARGSAAQEYWNFNRLQSVFWLLDLALRSPWDFANWPRKPIRITVIYRLTPTDWMPQIPENGLPPFFQWNDWTMPSVFQRRYHVPRGTW